MRVAIYARVSQADKNDPNSIGVQLTACRRRAAEEGWEVAAEYVDEGFTGWKPGVKRRGYEAMLAALEDGEFEAPLVRDHERLLRSDIEGARWLELHAQGKARQMLYVDEADVDLKRASDRKAWKERVASAVYYSDRMSEKVRGTLANRIEGGLWRGGGRPFGFDIVPADPDDPSAGKTLAIRDAEAKALRQAYTSILNGGSLGGAARDLDRSKLTTTRGNIWTRSSLRQTLLAARNAGLYEVDGEVVGAASWPSIIDRKTWEKAVAVLEDESRQQLGRSPRYLLTGLARCADHDTPLVGRPVNGARSYVCLSSGKLHLGIRAEPMEGYVGEAAWSAKLPAQTIVQDPASNDSAKILEEIEAAEAELADWTRQKIDGAVLEIEYRTAAEVLRGRITDAENRLSELAGKPKPGEWERFWSKATTRTIVEMAVDHVDVLSVGKGKGRWTPVEWRVRINWREGVVPKDLKPDRPYT